VSSLFLYLGSEGLTFLKSGLLPFLRPGELGQPFLSERPSYQAIQQNKLSQKDYIQHLQQQYQKLPDHLRNMVSFDYFVEQSEKKRSEIEAGIQRVTSAPISCPDLSQYRILRLFSEPALLSLWQGRGDSGMALELDIGLCGWLSEEYRGERQILAELKSVDSWLPEQQEDWLLQQPSSYSECPGEWRLLRSLTAADRLIQVTGQERAMYRLPYQGLKRIIAGNGWQPESLASLQAYVKRDLNLRQAQLAQLQLDPLTMDLEVIDLGR